MVTQSDVYTQQLHANLLTLCLLVREGDHLQLDDHFVPTQVHLLPKVLFTLTEWETNMMGNHYLLHTYSSIRSLIG